MTFIAHRLLLFTKPSRIVLDMLGLLNYSGLIRPVFELLKKLPPLGYFYLMVGRFVGVVEQA